jgi:DNA-binding MarR family transcriptional regulator
MFVDRILEEVFPDETGASRLQQVGLFTIVFALEGRAEPVTAARIAEITGQSDSQVHRQLQKLIARELIERTRVKNKLGRGHAWQLSIKHTPKSKKLVDAIRRASAGPPRKK